MIIEMVACLSALGKVKVAKQEETYVNLKDSEKKTWKEDIRIIIKTN